MKNAKPISLEETTDLVTTFVQELREKPTSNISILSKFDVFVGALQELPETESTPFVECILPFTISLYPHRLSDIKEAIHEIIDNYLLTPYVNDGVEGIFIMYKEMKIPKATTVAFDSSVLTIQLRLKCVLFVPSINTHLIGYVSQKSFDHHALLLYGVFNVNVSNELIRERVKVKLEINSYVRFKVRGMSFNCNPPIIEGDMSDNHSKLLKME
ncbi:RPA43 OB domain-containing protein [Entamoeba marina]